MHGCFSPICTTSVCLSAVCFMYEELFVRPRLHDCDCDCAITGRAKTMFSIVGLTMALRPRRSYLSVCTARSHGRGTRLERNASDVRSKCCSAEIAREPARRLPRINCSVLYVINKAMTFEL
jgi:hypothetical protein